MKKGASKQKGSEFERLIAKRISQWLSYGERSDLLWRSAMSGGRAQIVLRKGESASAQAGDLSSIDRASSRFIEYHTIECKFYRDLQIPMLVYGGKTGIRKFWEQACKDAKNSNKTPVLIAKQNFKPVLIGSTKAFFEQGNAHFTKDISVGVPSLDLYLADFELFTERVSPYYYTMLSKEDFGKQLEIDLAL